MSFGSFNQDGGAPMADINTTPLVDVMLVLLVIFIITAPLFHQAVPVDLPKVNATKLDDKPLVVSLALDAQGDLYLDGRKSSSDEAYARLLELAPNQPEMHLRAERTIPYEKVADALAMTQRAGIVKIAFVTDPKP